MASYLGRPDSIPVILGGGALGVTIGSGTGVALTAVGAAKTGAVVSSLKNSLWKLLFT